MCEKSDISDTNKIASKLTNNSKTIPPVQRISFVNIVHDITKDVEEPIKCSSCLKKFDSKYQLFQHVCKIQCEICKISFKDKFILHNHLKTHINDTITSKQIRPIIGPIKPLIGPKQGSDLQIVSNNIQIPNAIHSNINPKGTSIKQVIQRIPYSNNTPTTQMVPKVSNNMILVPNIESNINQYPKVPICTNIQSSNGPINIYNSTNCIKNNHEPNMNVRNTTRFIMPKINITKNSNNESQISSTKLNPNELKHNEISNNKKLSGSSTNFPNAPIVYCKQKKAILTEVDGSYTWVYLDPLDNKNGPNLNSDDKVPNLFCKQKNAILTKLDGIYAWVYLDPLDNKNGPNLNSSKGPNVNTPVASSSSEIISNNINYKDPKVPISTTLGPMNQKIFQNSSDKQVMTNSLPLIGTLEKTNRCDKNIKPLYFCPVCNWDTITFTRIKSHLIQIHDYNGIKLEKALIKSGTTRPLICEVCKLKYRTKKLLKNHMKMELLNMTNPHLNLECKILSTLNKTPLKAKKIQLDKNITNDKNAFIPDAFAKYIKIDHKYIYYCNKCNYKSHYYSENREHLLKKHDTIYLKRNMTRKLTKVWYCIICNNTDTKPDFCSTIMKFNYHFEYHHSFIFNDNDTNSSNLINDDTIPINKTRCRIYICTCCNNGFYSKVELEVHQKSNDSLELGYVEKHKIMYVCYECYDKPKFDAEFVYRKHYLEKHNVSSEINNVQVAEMDVDSETIVSPEFIPFKIKTEDDEMFYAEIDDYNNVQCKNEMVENDIAETIHETTETIHEFTESILGITEFINNTTESIHETTETINEFIEPIHETTETIHETTETIHNTPESIHEFTESILGNTEFMNNITESTHETIHDTSETIHEFTETIKTEICDIDCKIEIDDTVISEPIPLPESLKPLENIAKPNLCPIKLEFHDHDYMQSSVENPEENVIIKQELCENIDKFENVEITNQNHTSNNIENTIVELPKNTSQLIVIKDVKMSGKKVHDNDHVCYFCTNCKEQFFACSMAAKIHVELCKLSSLK